MNNRKKQNINRRRKDLLRSARQSSNKVCNPYLGESAPCLETFNDASPRKAIIFKSELAFICKHILEYLDIETGGELFGYWTSEGAPVILYAIGAGPKANHQVTFFNQDKGYLLSEGKILKERYGLQHIGEWHSHHKLGLARPSRHDAHTMISTIQEMHLGRFLLCIGNCTDSTSCLNCFMCEEDGYKLWGWELINQSSPIRDIKL